MSLSREVSTIDPPEIGRFNALAATWWDEFGPFKALHRINPIRLGFVRQTLIKHFGRDSASLRPFVGMSVLDIGCGGGLVSEPLARMGFSVTGIDAAGEGIDAARAHAAEQFLEIDYRQAAVEELAAEGRVFDVVVALEIVEHTADPAAFIAALRRVLRPGGLAILSTLNRTPKSYALGIVAAEWILGWVPRGTHSWAKFVKPSELAAAARGAGLALGELAGLGYDVTRNRWRLTDTLDVNYMAAFVKPGEAKC